MVAFWGFEVLQILGVVAGLCKKEEVSKGWSGSDGEAVFFLIYRYFAS